MGVEAAGEEVVNQPGLDPLLLRQQRLRLLNRSIQRVNDISDFRLFPNALRMGNPREANV